MAPLLRRAARIAAGSAIMAGTANAVTRRQQKRWESKDQAEAAGEQAAYQQGVADAQAAVPQTAAPQDDTTAQLEQLAALKNKGILTEEEFQAKKKQILGI